MRTDHQKAFAQLEGMLMRRQVSTSDKAFTTLKELESTVGDMTSDQIGLIVQLIDQAMIARGKVTKRKIIATIEKLLKRPWYKCSVPDCGVRVLPVLGMRQRQLLSHEDGQLAIFPGPQHQVPMIGHEAAGQYSDRHALVRGHLREMEVSASPQVRTSSLYSPFETTTMASSVGKVERYW